MYSIPPENQRGGANDPAYPEHRRDNTCSVCGAPDFRNCSCPWSKPFDSWGRAESRLLAAVGRSR
jgi:hypothetical protein